MADSITLAPVVVKPEADSKKESANLIPPIAIKGIAPIRDAPIHDKNTARKPSLAPVLNSGSFFLRRVLKNTREENTQTTNAEAANFEMTSIPSSISHATGTAVAMAQPNTSRSKLQR